MRGTHLLILASLMLLAAPIAPAEGTARVLSATDALSMAVTDSCAEDVRESGFLVAPSDVLSGESTAPCCVCPGVGGSPGCTCEVFPCTCAPDVLGKCSCLCGQLPVPLVPRLLCDIIDNCPASIIERLIELEQTEA